VTRSLTTGLALFTVYALCVCAAALAARFLRRPVPRTWLAALALPPLLFLWQEFLMGRTLLPADHAILTRPDPAATPTTVWQDDVARQFAPWAEAVRVAWRSGELPHRNRFSGSGMTLDGNGSSSAYSPFTLLGMLLPLPAAFTFWEASRLFLCLSGAWLWLAELGVSRRAACFGALCFSLSLSMTGWLNFPQTAVLALWPWVLFVIERLRERDVTNRAFLALTVLFFLLPLAGHIETVASMSAWTALWLAARWIGGERKGSGGVALRIAASALLALGLSAFSLLPQALAIGNSNRLALVELPFWTRILSVRPHGPAWGAGPLALFFPRIYGDLVSSPVIPGAPGAFPEIALGYFGIVGAALAALFARPGASRPTAERALLAPLLFGVGTAIGLWPFAEIAAHLPGLGHMFPLRYLTWAALAGAALAAYELDRLEKDLASRRSAAFWAIACFAALLALAAHTFWRLRPLYAAAGALPGQQNAFLLAAIALAAAIVVLASTAWRPGRFGRLGIPLLTLVAGVELYRQGSRLNRPSNPAQLYPSTPLVEFLRRRPGPFRFAGEGTALFPNVGVFAGLEDVRTHDPVERRDYVEFLNAACGYNPAAYFKELADIDAPALDFLNVRYLVSGPGRATPSEKWRPVYGGPDGTVFENTRALPRVFAPEAVRFVRSGSAGPRELDFRREAVVLDGPGGGFELASGAENRPVEVTDYVETTNSVSFRATVAGGPGDAILVASLVNDGGWRAHDETGAPIRLRRANGPFLALAVPAGDHRIRLQYATPGFRPGRWISAGSLLLFTGVVLALARRRQSRL
jgi:hypothetical protein